MRVGYVRVSTAEQNTARQEVIMETLKVEKIFIDKCSGKNTNRPQLNSMLDFVREGDTVVIETAIAGYNGIKLSVRYRMTDKETGELRTIAASEHCFLNRSGKPISLKRSYPEIDTKFFQMMDEES